MRSSSVIQVADSSSVGEARRFVQGLARDLGFGTTDAGKLALLTTELATNIVKHAGTGEILFRRLDTPGIELLALDRGPGMNDVAACLRDGYSTAGSPGTGLGAVSRLAHMFDVYSMPGAGTAVLARLCSKTGMGNSGPDYGVVCLPKPGEEYCGDAYALNGDRAHARVLLADGLGHGPLAFQAADAATSAFAAEPRVRQPREMLASVHQALRGTRGAAVALAVIDFDRGVLSYAGIGNIAACIVTLSGDNERRLVSQNGTAGIDMRKLQEFSYAWAPGASLVMHSDGLATQWRMSNYPGLLARDAALVAGVLYRDYRRGSDDVCVLVVRESAPQ